MILVENHLHICKNHSQNLRGNIKTIHEGHKDYKCGSCEKSFTGATSLRIHIKKIHEYHKDFKCKYCRKSLKLVIWEYIWKTFMKMKKISNGTLVEHYFLILITWKYTSKPFMNVRKISNVIILANHFLILITWEYTSKLFTNQKNMSHWFKYCYLVAFIT